MTTIEFSDAFDTLVNSYRRFKDFDKKEELDSIEFNEYEKSLFLTMAQDEIVVAAYTGRNAFGESFEGTEEMRRYLDDLVNTVKCNEDTSEHIAISPNSRFYQLPEDIAFIVYEQATFEDEGLGCFSGSIVNVQPVTHDEYNRTKNNPFRGPSKFRILRLDAGKGIVELVSKYAFRDYMMRYVAKPKPIILEDLSVTGLTIKEQSAISECQLNPVLHHTILKRAVQMALASKGIHINS